jgi:nicotinamidase-related amidase
MDQSKPTSALLVLDLQLGIINSVGYNADQITNCQKAIEHARSNNIQIIYSIVGFRPGYPEVSPNNKVFSFIKEKRMLSDPKDMEIHEAVSPKEGDLIVHKKRFSAFCGSDLEVILRAKGITDLTLCGISTGGAILSTIREAADKDYKLTILSDGCLDKDEEVHMVLLTKVLARQADVITVNEWINLK